MNTSRVMELVQESAVAEWMRNTLPAMQVIEITHVVAAVSLFGTIAIVDLRLLGVTDNARPYARVAREVLRLTWIAFAVAVVTGTLMFTTNAATYFDNWAFRLKALALLGAGLNMAIFNLVTSRRIANRHRSEASTGAARLAALLSILLWAAVVLLGRWIGFTKGYDFSVPSEVESLLVP